MPVSAPPRLFGEIMSKNKLTNSQKRNVARRVEKLHQKQEILPGEIQGDLGPVARGTVISRFGKAALVEDNDSRSSFKEATLESMSLSSKRKLSNSSVTSRLKPDSSSCCE